MDEFPVESLQLYDVQDPGSPNLERIAIYVKEGCDLGNYCLMIGFRNLDGSASPMKDNMLWFGRGIVNAGDWIFIYTAPGTPRIIDLPDQSGRLISIHWGKDQTVFQNKSLVPMLCQFGGISTPPLPEPQAQTMRITY
ncbi:hypothetical protein D3C76_1434690 [compost metagenome]